MSGPFDTSERLVESGLVSPSEVSSAREARRRSGRLMEELLLDAHALSEEALARFFAEEYGYPLLSADDLARVAPAPELREAVPAELAHEGIVLPLFRTAHGSSLDVAVAFPTNRSLLDLLQSFGGARSLCLSVAPRSALRTAIKAYYGGAGVHAFATAPSGRVRRVVVADADPHLRSLWRVLLDRVGQPAAEADSPAAVADQLKTAEYDLVVARFGPAAEDYLRVARAAGETAEVRFVEDPREALLGEPVPYSAMRRFFFSTLRVVLSVLGGSHGVPAGAILAAPRLASAVAEALGCSALAVDEVEFAAYLGGVARAVGEAPVTFAQATERSTGSPYGASRLLAASEGALAPGRLPVGARILRVVSDFLQAMKAHDGSATRAVAAVRESSRSGDGPVVEALVHVLYREHIAGLTPAAPAAEVLLARRDDRSAQALELLFRNEGFSLRRCGDGRSAEAELALSPPDVLVADVALAGTDGYTLCRAAKKRFRVPTILVTDGADPLDRVRADAVEAAGLFLSDAPLADVLRRAREILPPNRRPRPQPRCEGQLAQVRPRILLSWLCAARADAEVHLRVGGRAERVVVHGGKVESSWLGEGALESAEPLLDAREGTFAVFDQSFGVRGESP